MNFLSRKTRRGDLTQWAQFWLSTTVTVVVVVIVCETMRLMGVISSRHLIAEMLIVSIVFVAGTTIRNRNRNRNRK